MLGRDGLGVPAELIVQGRTSDASDLHKFNREELIDLGDALESTLFGGEAPAEGEDAVWAERRVVLDVHRDAAPLLWEDLRVGVRDR